MEIILLWQIGEYPNAVYNTPLSALTVEKTLASDLVPLGYQATGTIDTAHSLVKLESMIILSV